MATIKLGIDMGSTTTTIFRLNSGLVLREPSMVMIETTKKGDLVREVGVNAYKFYGKTPDFKRVVSPICEGVVQDIKSAVKMLKYFVQKVTSDNPDASVDALINIPSGATLDERKKLAVVAYNAGINNVNLIPNVIACAIGAGCDISGGLSSLIVDIGGGCTDIAVVGCNSIINGLTINIGAKQMDISIQDYVEKKYGIHINLDTAKMLKEEIGSLMARDTATMQVSGIDVDSNDIRSVNVTANVIFDAINEYYELIADSINGLISTCTPDIMANLHAHGVVICGKAGQVVGLDDFMNKRLGLGVAVIGGDCTANGLGMLLNDKKLLRQLIDEDI